MSDATTITAIDRQPVKAISHRTAAEVLMLVTTFCWSSNIVAGKLLCASSIGSSGHRRLTAESLSKGMRMSH